MEDDYDHVTRLVELNQFDEARSRLHRLIAKYPDDPVPVLLLANVHILEGSPHAARQTIDQAMIVSPDLQARELGLASMLFLLLGDVTQAISHGRRAIEIDPDDWRAHAALARAYAADPRRNLLPEAEEHAGKAAELAPEESQNEPAPAQQARFSRSSARSWVALALCVVCIGFGGTILTWLGRAMEGLLRLDRAQDDAPLIGIPVVLALAAAGWGIHRAVKVRRGGDRLSSNIQRRRALSRELHATLSGKRAASATNLAIGLCFLPFLITGGLATPVLDEDGPPSPGAAAVAAAVIAALSLLLLSILRWWFGPRQLWRFFASSLTLCIYVLIAVGLMATSITMAVAQVMNQSAWLIVFALHFAWMPAVIVPMLKVTHMGRKPT